VTADSHLGAVMWTPATREKYSRLPSQYQSDVTDGEWRVIEPLIRTEAARKDA